MPVLSPSPEETRTKRYNCTRDTIVRLRSDTIVEEIRSCGSEAIRLYKRYDRAAQKRYDCTRDTIVRICLQKGYDHAGHLKALDEVGVEVVLGLPAEQLGGVSRHAEEMVLCAEGERLLHVNRQGAWVCKRTAHRIIRGGRHRAPALHS
eukprot:1195651-Prorocentrum_minimum.AAC.4